MHHFRSPTLAALLVPFLAVTSASLLSAADGDASPTVDAHLKELDQEIQDLKRQLSATQGTGPNSATSQSQPTGVQAQLAVVRANSDDGFLIESIDHSNRLRIGGYADFDGRFFSDDKQYLNGSVSGASAANGANTFYVRHARPELSATVDDIFDFRLLAEFAPTQSANTNTYTQNPVLLDAYVASHINPALVVTVGQFKSPVGLEYLQYTPDNEFVELGLASNLVPGRDEGVQLSGKIAQGIIFYQVGIFNGGIDGTANVYNDTNSGKDGEGRIIISPFITTDFSLLKDLNLGVSGTYGKELGSGAATTSTALPSFNTTSQLTFFAYKDTTFESTKKWRIKSAPL